MIGSYNPDAFKGGNFAMSVTEQPRRYLRKPFDHTGGIDLCNGTPQQECSIVDISTGGARIRVSHAERVPERFSLHLSYNGAVGRPCRVVWRTGRELGVEFL
jgi:hypothetical protein